jgi:hypothetical protein
MSEYQYYEFQAVDRPLTPEQISVLRAYSSRAQITASSFIVVYNYGGFKGNPEKWLEKYFDAFLYLANWGSHHLMLGVPIKLLDQETLEAYCTDQSLSCRLKGDKAILTFQSEDEEGEWAEGEGWLASLLPIRADLLSGDYRALYLGWLSGLESGEIDDDELEPSVPAGLGTLNASLDRLADFLRLSRELIAAAAEASHGEKSHGLSRKQFGEWVLKLPSKEKDSLLLRLVEGDNPHLLTELQKRAIRELRGEVDPVNGPRRTAGQIRERAEILIETRRRMEAEKRTRDLARREQEEAEKRKKYLRSLIGKEGILWKKVEELIATKQPKRYDEAVSLLGDLKDLAQFQNRIDSFHPRVRELVSAHLRKATLVDKINRGKILEGIVKEGNRKI